uniref:G_PROTEIN_RECEP_F3_4 domain-containing protein n=1 Tax=Strongyloides stercoralis TaxID=6248 RepID=A0A0K0EBL6_STRER
MNDENFRLEVFLASYKVAKKVWSRKQKQLMKNPHSTSTDKKVLLEHQAKELESMLNYFNIKDETSYLIPYEWDNAETHPRLEKLTNIIVNQISKNGNIRPFMKGSNIEFGLWKDDIMKFIKKLTVDEEDYQIDNQLCMSLASKLILQSSEVKSYFDIAMKRRMNEEGRLKQGLLVSNLFNEMWHDMRKSNVNRNSQMLAQQPKWLHGKDTLKTFNKKYNKYLCQRLGVQVVSAFLDGNQVLRREYYMNYQFCIPSSICKEVKFDIYKDVAWDAFLKLFIDAEDFMKTWDRLHHITNKKNHNRTNHGNKNYYHKNNFYSKTTPYQSNKNYYNQKTNDKYNDKFLQNTSWKQKKGNNNSNNTRITKLNRNNKRFILNNGKQNNKNQNNLVNTVDIEELSRSICRQVQNMLLTAKMSALIILSIIMLMVPSVNGQLTGYNWEDCNNPRLPYFYRLPSKHLETIVGTAVSLTLIGDDCAPLTDMITLIGIEYNNIFITWSMTVPLTPTEYFYKDILQNYCELPEVVKLENGDHYARFSIQQEINDNEIADYTQITKEIREEFWKRCTQCDHYPNAQIKSKVSETNLPLNKESHFKVETTQKNTVTVSTP